MHIDLLGELTRDNQIEEWFHAGYWEIPFLGNEELQIIVVGIEGDPSPEDFSNTFKAFLDLPETERTEAERLIFQNYRQYVDAVADSELEFSVNSRADVWKHVYFTSAYLSRNPGDREVYVQITGNCDWDVEHGLQIVLRNGRKISRLSGQDGHLTASETDIA